MALRVSIAQAVLNAFAAYLQTKMPDTKCRGRWAPPDRKASPLAITVTRAGDVEYLGTGVYPISSTVTSATTVTTVWSVFNCTMPVQLDAWAVNDPSLDDMIARLDELLNAGNTPINGTLNPVAEGVVVPLADGFEGAAEFVLPSPRPQTTSDSVQRSDWRAISHGFANFVLSIKTTDPRLVSIKLKQLIHQELVAPTTLPIDSVVISAAGVNYLTGP